MWIFGSTINKVTIYYVIVAIAGSKLLADLIAVTKTNSETFFILLATLDFSHRSWKLLRRHFYQFHGPFFRRSLADRIKEVLAPWFNPLEGAHIIFIPGWCVSVFFIFVIRAVST